MVRERIAERGPIPYADVVELALYHDEHGFYRSGGRAGRRGDFITSPEVGPLFGHLISRAIDAEWERLGRPKVFTVVDFGAGPGTLARSVRAAEPRCSAALRYVAIETSPEQRSQHPEEVLSLDELTPEVVGDGLVGVVLANELLDNLSFTPVERSSAGVFHRLVVSIGDEGDLTATPGTALEPAEAALVGEGAERAVMQSAAAQWLGDMIDSMSAGRVIVIDYARTESALVEIRTYADHGNAGDPLCELGEKDITVDVDLAQLERAVRPATSIVSQASWLEDLGVEALVEEGRQLWTEGAAAGSLVALRARSRIREAEALVADDGLGGFLVAEWEIASI